MILKFFLFYALVCLVIFIVACLVLFIGYRCASSRDRHFIRERHSQMYKTISAAREQCEKLQNDLQNNKPKFWQSSYYYAAIQKNFCNVSRPPFLPTIIVIKKCLDTFATVERELSTIQERLKLSKPEPTNQHRKAPLFLYSGVSMIGLLLTTQVLTALLCLFLLGTIGLSLIAGSMTLNVDNPLSSVIFKYCNINIDNLYSFLIFEDCPLLETSVWIIVAIVFIILSISLITRIIRLIVCQCEILFMGCRISISILLTDLTKAQITEEFEQLSQDIQSRNLSSYIGKIMHRIFD